MHFNNTKFLLFNFLKYFRSFSAFKNLASHSVGVIGVPFNKGQEKAGVEETPSILRQAGLIDILTDKISAKDYGDLNIRNNAYNHEVYKNMKSYSEFLECSKTLIKKVEEVLCENDSFLAIGGDHSIGFGSIAGHLLYNPNISVIWIDAHPDINLSTTSVTGNIHGMPVAMLLQELRKFWSDFNLQEIAPICFPAKELIYIGLRAIDPYESYILEKLGIKFFAMNEIDKYGIPKVIEMALAVINVQNKIHVSIDIDALDTDLAPSTGTPVHGGLTLREAMYIMESLYSTNRVQGVDFVELNAKIGTKEQSNRTITAGLQILKSLYGSKRSGSET